MKEIILVTFYCLILVIHVWAFCHIIYQVFKLKTRFNMMLVWISLLPVIGPMIYFAGKKER